MILGQPRAMGTALDSSGKSRPALLGFGGTQYVAMRLSALLIRSINWCLSGCRPSGQLTVDSGQLRSPFGTISSTAFRNIAIFRNIFRYLSLQSFQIIPEGDTTTVHCPLERSVNHQLFALFPAGGFIRNRPRASCARRICLHNVNIILFFRLFCGFLPVFVTELIAFVTFLLTNLV